MLNDMNMQSSRTNSESTPHSDRKDESNDDMSIEFNNSVFMQTVKEIRNETTTNFYTDKIIPVLLYQISSTIESSLQ